MFGIICREISGNVVRTLAGVALLASGGVVGFGLARVGGRKPKPTTTKNGKGKKGKKPTKKN